MTGYCGKHGPRAEGCSECGPPAENLIDLTNRVYDRHVVCKGCLGKAISLLANESK
jgi:hypothetical protein